MRGFEGGIESRHEVRTMKRRGWTHHVVALAGVVLAWTLVGVGSHGQYSDLTVRTVSEADRVEMAVHDLERGETDAAIAALDGLVASQPALMAPRHGAAAYWLGEAYARRGDASQAASTWKDGMHAVHEAGRFDVRLADAYLQTRTPASIGGDRLFAAEVYARLMGAVGPDGPSDLQAIYRRYTAQIEPMLSDDALATVLDAGRRAKPSEWTFAPGAGAFLTSWWRRLDPIPATSENERLEEHVLRLLHANHKYACPSRPSALDDRGRVYLRYGEAPRQHTVTFDDGEFLREVYRFGVDVNPSDFPDNEFWVYTNIDDRGYYLFTESRRDCYEIASANDLLPGHLQQYRGTSDRGLNIAYSAMMALRHIYRQLALYHIDYSDRYSTIASYVGEQETQAAIAEAEEVLNSDQPAFDRGGTKVGAGTGQTRRVFADRSRGVEPPNRFVASMVSRGKRDAAVAEHRRDEAMPQQHTTLLDDTGTLPVAVRTARFLTPDGETRTEVSWGTSTRTLALRDADDAEVDPSMLAFTAVRYDAAYRQEKTVQQQHTVRPADLRLPVYVGATTRLGATKSVAHLGLQWTQYGLVTGGQTTVLGRREKQATMRVDSLAPLAADPSTLEMSDVQVMVAPRDTASALVNPRENGIPYPFTEITPSLPLLLYFEAYHLTYGADDRTRYTVAYAVEGQTRRGWTRLFRGDDTRRTTTSTTVEGTSRRAEEVILLDLTEIAGSDTQDVRVTVRVTDEVTGQTVAREVDFVLQ